MNSKVVFIWFLILISGYSNAQDWPDWRGINRDGTWAETGIVEKFESVSLVAMVISNRIRLFRTYSCSGKVYVTDLLKSPSQTEGILCFDELTGKKLWEYRYPCEVRWFRLAHGLRLL